MDKENKSEDGTKKDQKPPCDKKNDRLERSRDSYSPKLTKPRWVFLVISILFLLAALIYLLGQFCSFYFVPRVCVTYFVLGVLLTIIIFLCLLRHEFTAHEARLVDPSIVEATIVEAETVEPRLKEPVKKPDNYEKKEKDLKDEVRALREIGKDGWSEYRVLSLNQMLVDFLEVDELISSARLSLTEVEDYAEDSARRYDWEQYYRWQQKIEEAIRKIEQIDVQDPKDYDAERDKAAEALRAELQMLLEHVASYTKDWAEGSVIIRGIIRCGVLALFPLLGMGLLPLVHPASNDILHIPNWGMLGVSGAITAVLLSLRKSDVVEVGNTEGKKELWHAVLGVGLGLVAGVLAYSLIASDLLNPGGLIPNITNPEAEDIAMSIVWAVVSGFSFEKILDLARGTTVGGS